MYLRKTSRSYKDKTYTNHLLVESVQTPKAAPSLWASANHSSGGAGSRLPSEQMTRWRGPLLQGQVSLPGTLAAIPQLTDKARHGKKRSPASRSAIAVEPDQITMEGAREAGPVHVGHQLWQQLGIETTLHRSGFSPRACRLTKR